MYGSRRNPNVNICLYPVAVQGNLAAKQIVEAIEYMNENKIADVLIIGRGGGSLEDLKEVNITATKRHYVSRSEGEIFSQHQAECMIKTFIPIKYITNINNPERMYF